MQQYGTHIFALLDPDPESEYGSGSTDPIEYGSNTDPDPDPQPWGELRIREFIFKSDYFFCIPGYLKERAHNFALMMTNVY